MSESIVKLIEAFYQAKRVNHYYWLHTDGDAGDISVENIQEIICRLTGVTVEKHEVDVESNFHRAFIERYNNGKSCKIYVISNETKAWKRFATVKELCHILIDSTDQFQPDPCAIIEALKDPTGLLDEHVIPAVQSEGFAEIIALELIYPMEFRRADLAAIACGKTHDVIANERVIPVNYVYKALDPDMLRLCDVIWPLLRDVEPANLNDYI